MTRLHTPLPWKVNVPHGNDLDLEITGYDEFVVAIFDPRESLVDFENADLIVRACNNHYELLQALEAIVFQASQGKVFERDACITQAKEAIAKAKRNT